MLLRPVSPAQTRPSDAGVTPHPTDRSPVRERVAVWTIAAARRMKFAVLLAVALSCLLPAHSWAQAEPTEAFDLQTCLAYALRNDPGLRAARLDDSLAALDNRILTSVWLPSLSVDANAQHFFQRPVAIFPDFENPASGQTREVQLGTINSSLVGASASQLVYSPEGLRDLRLQEERRNRARLDVEAAAIELRARIATAFYEALRAREALRLAEADIVRLERSLSDARLYFEEGITDKVDYKRATIALNSARARARNARLQIDATRETLRTAMGYPADTPLDLRYDYAAYQALVARDSVVVLDPQRRVELRQLAVDLAIQRGLTDYRRRAWLPTVTADGRLAVNWFNDEISRLYGQGFPQSFAQVNVQWPIIRGGRRIHEVRRAEVLEAQLGLRAVDQATEVEREYAEALARYLSSRNDYLVAVDNRALAEEIYEVVDLQYREGIAPFLDVVIAENDLQRARIEILDGVTEALIARVELRRAAGTLNRDDGE